MSVITSELTVSECAAATGNSVRNGGKNYREEEFRSALDAYVADYLDYQARRNQANGGTAAARFPRDGFFQRFAEWLHHQVVLRQEQAGLDATPPIAG